LQKEPREKLSAIYISAGAATGGDRLQAKGWWSRGLDGFFALIMDEPIVEHEQDYKGWT
jgi:hypothetical protein